MSPSNFVILQMHLTTIGKWLVSLYTTRVGKGTYNSCIDKIHNYIHPIIRHNVYPEKDFQLISWVLLDSHGKNLQKNTVVATRKVKNELYIVSYTTEVFTNKNLRSLVNCACLEYIAYLSTSTRKERAHQEIPRRIDLKRKSGCFWV